MRLSEIANNINSELQQLITESIFISNKEYEDYFNEITNKIVQAFKDYGVEFVVGRNRHLYYSNEEPIVFANIDADYKVEQNGILLHRIRLIYEEELGDLDMNNIPMASYYFYRLRQIDMMEKNLMSMKSELLNMQERIAQREFEIKRAKDSLEGYIS